ncbi:MAG TPA: hypothetical protein PLE99_10510 [Candidatus Thiothrix moscowensis]|uniref:hypothetical protein n=1 Tax=unclassified Thiothrix TaxID=2636184 RepID=UPI0025FB187C|nr:MULTISPECIES: hypothetical protein [unclassified Thiothrix]HRJ53192.1 hypothetical protein [Candidatus Thiothrix moscowensis]HRJ93238.1 hypothetical protein [Candidatus Thiothrix moscowensis]
MKKIVLSLAVLAGLGLSACAPVSQVKQPEPTVIPAKDLNWIADKVFKNETSGNPALLVVWNDREEFASLGIGHFIWYPEGRRGPYTETFPGLLDYAKSHAIPLPQWLQNRTLRGAPWPNKDAFQRAQNDPEMNQLRNFLQQTMNIQANYMSERLTRALPMMLNQLTPRDRERALRNYQAVEKSPRGLYPLLDYVNFKGEGTSPTERYNGQGWGLLQVLLAMNPVEAGPQALAEFARAAEEVLTRRIANAPPERDEAKWLPGWRNRLGTYQPQSLLAGY